MSRYQLYRIGKGGHRAQLAELYGDSDGEALAEALHLTENGADHVLCQGERQIAEIEVNDNSRLFGRGHAPRLQRPASIRSFEALFLGAMAIGILHILDAWRHPPAARAESYQAAMTILLVLSDCLLILLCMLVSRRRSLFSMWALLSIFAVAGLIALRNLLVGRLIGLSPVSVAQVCAELLALALLFTPASRLWMQYSG